MLTPVIVVGAGFAGLSAAVRLCLAGKRVLVLEARPRLGGRASAFEDKATGAQVDNGQHVLFGCYRETLALLRTVGAADKVRAQRALDVPFIDASGRKTRLRCPALPAPLHLLGGLLAWEALDWRDRWAALRVWRAIRRGGGLSPIVLGDGQLVTGPVLSVRDWLVALGQTTRLRELLWEPLAVAALNEPPAEASAAAFAEVLALMFRGGPRNSAIVMPAAPLDQMYAEPARAFIERHGGRVRTNALAKITATAAGVTAVRTGADTLSCPRVISSVPWNAMGNLFDELPAPLRGIADAAARVTSRPIVTANIWFDRRVLDEPFVGLPGCTIQWVFDKGTDRSHLSCIVSGAVDLVDRPADDILALALADIRGRLPGARAAHVTRATVVRERHATFSTAQPDVPRPSCVTPVPGFFLAGDWIATGLPGTIEGAVRSGRLAADALLAAEL
ncbi:MAG TPA: hydroxysqualene dehydroxylase HpnE [Vicinamibacterales bacterium]|nr:hydroxysqualene dehydroxylase HpnE [Vicinamibacterales bacterium]